jgi:multicomponent Na+:H+ antiporter subunit D
MDTLAPLTVAVPLICAAALAATNFISRRLMTDVVAVAASAAVTTFCAILLARSVHGPIVYWFGGWKPSHGVALGISFSIDSLGAGTATFAALLVTASLLFSVRYFQTVGALFHSLMLVFLAAMAGFSLTGDLFNMFVFFELMSGAAYALTAYKIEERGPLQGAINFAVTNTLGAFAILTGIALVYAKTGALNLAQIGQTLAGQHAGMTVIVGFLLIITGFLVKAAVVPLHFWLADAHAVAPVPVCVLFSGVMVQLGLYGVARVYWTVFSGPFAAQAGDLRNILIWMGVVTALVGGAMCFGQRHLKRLLAFSTVSHSGIFLIGIALLTPEGVAGTTTYVLAHGLTKAGLFMCVGILLHRFASVDLYDLRGRGREILPLAVPFAAGGLLLAAAPMLGTFFGKSLIGTSSLELGYGWLPSVLVASSILTGGAVLRLTGVVFGGWGPPEPLGQEPGEEAQFQEAREEEPETSREPSDHTPLPMIIPPVVLLAAALVIGLVPHVVHGIEHAAAHFVDRRAYVQAVLFGRVHFPHGSTSPLTTTDFLYSAGATVGAILVAAIPLFGWRTLQGMPDRFTGPLDRAVGGLRALHSGVIGDYVAWLTAGLAALGGLFALTLR